MTDSSRPGAKGHEIEEALRAYFFEAGYFVVRGLPYQLDGEDVTDVDLWLYERPAAATRRRIIVDVKNKKSPKAAERIIWTRGLQAALGADSAIVATTDRRPSSRKLAKALGITLFDGDAIARVTGAKRLSAADILRYPEVEQLIKEVDSSRRSTTWRDTIFEARGSLLSGMGVSSANKCLGCFGFFAHEATIAYPGSRQSELAVRLSYLSAALALISLDFVIADHAFRPIEDRRATIVNAVRYGQADAHPQLATLNAALSLARKYATNGAAVAKQIELQFAADAGQIHAEIIADFVARISGGDAMFQLARLLESASNQRSLVGFDHLPSAAKGALGAFLDFNDVSRERFARSWQQLGVPNSQIPGAEGQPSAVSTESDISMHSSLRSKEKNAEEIEEVPNAGPLFDVNGNGDEYDVPEEK